MDAEVSRRALASLVRPSTELEISCVRLTADLILVGSTIRIDLSKYPREAPELLLAPFQAGLPGQWMDTAPPRPDLETRDTILSKIDSVLAEDDFYEPGEPRPSAETVDRAKSLIQTGIDPERGIPRAEVSAYFGELDVTWRCQNRLLRLVVFPDATRRPVLYSQTDNGDALTRGHSIEVTGPAELSNRLDWLLA